MSSHEPGAAGPVPAAEAVLGACPDAIWVLDGQGRTVYANAATATLLGVEPGEVAGICVHDLLDEDGDRIFRPHLERMDRSRASHEEQACRLRRPDGSVTWVRVRHAPLADEDGQVVSWLHRLTELPGEQRELDELQRREQSFTDVQRIARVGSWEWDRSTQRLTATDELYEFYGIDPGWMDYSLTGFLSRVHADDRDFATATIMRSWKEAGTFEFDFRLESDAGELRWFRSRGQAVRDSEGHVVRLTGTSQDITATKQQENALAFLSEMGRAANEARSLREVLGAADGMVKPHAQWPGVLVSMPTGSDGAGLRHRDVAGDDPGGDRARFARELADRAAYGREVVVAPRPGGGTVLVAGAVVARGRLACVIVSDTLGHAEPTPADRDAFAQTLSLVAQVAEREWVAEELSTARDEALAASRAKSDFLATMSHEIRTPLNGVIGLSELLGSTELTPHQGRLTSGVVQAGRTLLTLVNDILDLSKIEAGRMDLEQMGFDPLAVVEQSVGLVTERAREKQLELAVSTHGGLPSGVRGDPVRFGQVVTNLVANAVKFTGSGEVVVTLSSDPRPDGVLMTVEVSDTGIGVEAGVADSLFEAFSQADSSTTREYGGTGLGLAISKRIVTAMGGEIGVRSEKGVGSTFWFTVPTIADDSAGGVDQDLHDVVAGLRVLVVDDNETNRLILTEQLTGWRVAVTATASGYEALLELDRAQRAGTPYDVVLSDYMMPGTDGEQLARFVRGEARHDRTRLVLLSSGTEPTGDLLSDAGIDVFLSKPVLPSRLLDTLAALSGGQAVVRAGAPEHVRAGRREGEREGGCEAVRRGRVLVAEDNPVNQMVAERVLTRSGYEVVVADNGALALDVLDADADGFDAVLMDCQMPVMDGYAATRAIRERERETGRRIPVLAMTAAVTSEERERCLASGMDDFLTKPVDVGRLEATLARWIPEPVPSAAPAADSVGLASGEERPVLARDRLEELRSTGAADTDLLRRMITRFGERARATAADLEHAVADVDLDRAGQAAHDLRGSAATLGLERLAALAEELELAAGEGRTPPAGPLAGLGPAISAATAALDDFGRSLADPPPPGQPQ